MKRYAIAAAVRNQAGKLSLYSLFRPYVVPCPRGEDKTVQTRKLLNSLYPDTIILVGTEEFLLANVADVSELDFRSPLHVEDERGYKEAFGV